MITVPVRSTASEPEDPNLKIRIRRPKSRFDDSRRLLEQGKITDEAFLDAEGDYHMLSRNEFVKGFRSSFERAVLRSAQADVELAEQLQSKYLDSTPKPATKDAKPM